MNTHTPGPWELRGSRLVTDSQGVLIAENIGANYPGTPEANARLIAAAPDLLAACKRMSEALRNAPHETQNAYQGILTDIDNAIAKAEGTA